MLGAFQGGTAHLGATELAAIIGADRSTAFRLAQALVRLGWLRQNRVSKKYTPGIRLWELGATAIADLDVRRSARPHMRELSAVTGESSDLAVLDGYDALYVERFEGANGLRIYTRIGMRVPAYAIAMGKVLLAYLKPEERMRHVPMPLHRHTQRTLASLEDLNRECERVLRDGYAVNRGEWRSDAGGMAASVFDHTGDCVAAVSIDLPVSRMSARNIEELSRTVKLAAARISRDMGLSFPSSLFADSTRSC